MTFATLSSLLFLQLLVRTSAQPYPTRTITCSSLSQTVTDVTFGQAYQLDARCATGGGQTPSLTVPTISGSSFQGNPLVGEVWVSVNLTSSASGTTSVDADLDYLLTEGDKIAFLYDSTCTYLSLYSDDQPLVSLNPLLSFSANTVTDGIVLVRIMESDYGSNTGTPFVMSVHLTSSTQPAASGSWTTTTSCGAFTTTSWGQTTTLDLTAPPPADDAGGGGNDNTALAIGLGIGISLIVIIAIIIIVVILVRKCGGRAPVVINVVPKPPSSSSSSSSTSSESYPPQAAQPGSLASAPSAYSIPQDASL